MATPAARERHGKSSEDDHKGHAKKRVLQIRILSGALALSRSDIRRTGITVHEVVNQWPEVA
jgi:hypothetical protein